MNASNVMYAIRVGIGGWTFEPWRDGGFYPPSLPQARELKYASRAVTSIEINGTYYGSQKPESFERWHDETPDDFVFSMKASRFCTNRRVLVDAEESIRRFIGSGISRLREKLGPVVWQFLPTKRFDAEDFSAFLALLPKEVDGLPLRHVMDVRHESFKTDAYLELASRHRVATVFTDSPDYPSFADATGDFIYARLMCSAAAEPDGYPPQALDVIAQTAHEWQQGTAPGNLPYVSSSGGITGSRRDVFVYFINGAKERAPSAAQALLKRLGFIASSYP